MSQPDDPRTAVQVAIGLTGAVEGLGGKVENLAAYGHRNRRMIWGLVISIVLDLALTVVVAIFAVQAHDANTAAAAIHASSVTACRSANVSRAQQVQLWEHIAQISTPPPHETPAQEAARRKTVAGFLAYVRKTFAPRNCAALYKLP